MLELRVEIFAVADAPRGIFRERFGQLINLVEKPAVT
jgi:hypothetical protein